MQRAAPFAGHDVTRHSASRAFVGAGDRVVAIVGSYGSGKTELAVNLSLRLAAAGRRVQIADLDIVNPYFRCREARDLMEAHGIRVVVPPGAQAWADLPIILPEIRGMLRPPLGVVTILDVGGDDVGARSLASFRPHVRDGEYELWQVINAKRPFTSTVDGCLAMKASIEQASRWKVTGLLVNSHLIDDTTVETVLEGWRLASDVSARSGLPVRFVAAMGPLAAAPQLSAVDAPILPLERHMLPPWRQPVSNVDRPEPAPRPRPLGVPPAVVPISREGVMHGQNRD
jgi:hypothetical protein